MSEFSFSGIDDFIFSMEKVANIPEEVQDEILVEQADVLVHELRLRGEGYGVSDTGAMLQSIKAGKPKKGKKGGRQLVVSPRGKRKDGKTNGEVAFLNNYGTRHQMARPFWTDTEKLTERTMEKVGAEVYDKYLVKNGL